MAAVWAQLKTHCITSGFKGSKAREDCYYSVVFLQQLLLLSRGQSPASCSTSERGRRSLNAGWETGFPSHNNLLVLWGNISSPGQCKGQKFVTLKDCMVDFPGTGDLFQDFELSIQPWGSWMPEETGGAASVCAAALWSTNLEDLVSGWQRRPEVVGIVAGMSRPSVPQSKQPRESLGFPWPCWRHADSQRDSLGQAHFFITFSSLTMLAFLGRQKLSLTKCLISSNGLITISSDFYDLFGRGTCLASCLLIHCSIIHPLLLDNTFIWNS